MWGLFELLKFSFSSIVWGIFITIVCMTLFFVLIRGWYKSATFKPVSYLIGIILFFLLSFQCTMIVGALKIIHISDEYESQIQQVVNKYYSPMQEVEEEQSRELIQMLIEENPVLEYYVGGGEFTGYSAAELPQAVGKALRTFLRWYILRRLLWCIGFVVVGAILVIRTISQSYSRQRQSTVRHSSHPSRSSTRGDF